VSEELCLDEREEAEGRSKMELGVEEGAAEETGELLREEA